MAECPCTASTSSDSLLTPHCNCPTDDGGIVIHEDSCQLYKNETFIYPHEVEACECVDPPADVCPCCSCLPDKCFCKRAGKDVLDKWRLDKALESGNMPHVLDADHPLMYKFQQTLKQFLEKENKLAADEILYLKDELILKKQAYDKDLENIYTDDHDTNSQRVMIEEYQANISKSKAEREEAEEKAREANARYKKIKDKLEKDTQIEREVIQEMEALNRLCSQLQKWKEETVSDLTVSQRMSDKMKQQKQAMADEKRQLDMFIFALNDEVWKLESRLEMFQKQLEIKNREMENVNDKVTAYAVELEDLDLDKRRLVSLWNAVLVNIGQRDRAYSSVKDDYSNLQENYQTLVTNLELTKKAVVEEMNKGKGILVVRDKLNYDIAAANKLYDAEDQKRIGYEAKLMEFEEAMEMNERDQNMIKMENQTMRNILKTTEKELDHRAEQKLKMENEILQNLQECLLNDKSVQAMADGIKKIRDITRKQEIALMTIENQHAKVMLDIEVYRYRQSKNKVVQDELNGKVRAREDEITALEEKYQETSYVYLKKQRELDVINKKYTALKDVYDAKSPQERRVAELATSVSALRQRTEELQTEWLRLQGLVVRLAAQHHRTAQDLNLLNTQIQICENKSMALANECAKITNEKNKVERSLRDLRGRLEVLERTKKDSVERNVSAEKYATAMTHEYVANLKDAESEIIQLEEDIENLEKEKMTLTQDLDKVQREALIWQRKGIQALELKRNVKEAKSSAGDIGQMKSEIHKMEIRRDHLRRVAERLADDLAECVTKRDNVMEKSRAQAAVEKAHGGANTSQTQYHHKLRLARADVARVTKDLADAKARMEFLGKERERLEKEIADVAEANNALEENVAAMLREAVQADREKQWLLERVVRSQRLGTELATAVKRQSLKVRKPKHTLLHEYKQSRTFNRRMRMITDILLKEYPFMEDKVAIVNNTLQIFTPGNSPRLTEDCECEEEPKACGCDENSEQCDCHSERDVNVAEKPLCP